jgi:site-specific DNA-methyltransferase (adenine-specific)
MTSHNRSSKNHSNRIITHRSADRSWAIHYGDINNVLPTLPPVMFDGALFDPPYGLNFMGHKWDGSVPSVGVFEALLRLCKPGAYLLAFGGPRTFHRLACNIEDAGWEIRDTLCWLYGEGFPKSHNISKAIDKKLGAKRRRVGTKINPHRGSKAQHRYGFAKPGEKIEVTAPGSDEARRWDGYGTALKPAWEPIILAMKPVGGSFAENALVRGNGGLNIDECRIGTSGGSTRSHQALYPRLADGTEDRSQWARSGHDVERINMGRWPANLLLDEQAAELLDEQYGTSRFHRRSNVGNGNTLNPFKTRLDVVQGYNDSGGASRFFYCAKANGSERQGNDHPTVKPLALCEYLARLILQPERDTPRRLLVPYSGSGSEMIAALSAGWDHVTGIEWHEPYVATARRRLSKHKDGFARPA